MLEHTMARHIAAPLITLVTYFSILGGFYIPFKFGFSSNVIMLSGLVSFVCALFLRVYLRSLFLGEQTNFRGFIQNPMKLVVAVAGSLIVVFAGLGYFYITLKQTETITENGITITYRPAKWEPVPEDEIPLCAEVDCIVVLGNGPYTTMFVMQYPIEAGVTASMVEANIINSLPDSGMPFDMKRMEPETIGNHEAKIAAYLFQPDGVDHWMYAMHVFMVEGNRAIEFYIEAENQGIFYEDLQIIEEVYRSIEFGN
jgi:hypothetical protein